MFQVYKSDYSDAWGFPARDSDAFYYMGGYRRFGWPIPCFTNKNWILLWEPLSREEAIKKMREAYPRKVTSYTEGIERWVSHARGGASVLWEPYKFTHSTNKNAVKISGQRERPHPIKLHFGWYEDDMAFQIMLDRVSDELRPDLMPVWEKYPGLAKNGYDVVVNRLLDFLWRPYHLEYALNRHPRLLTRKERFYAAGYEYYFQRTKDVNDLGKPVLSRLMRQYEAVRDNTFDRWWGPMRQSVSRSTAYIPPFLFKGTDDDAALAEILGLGAKSYHRQIQEDMLERLRHGIYNGVTEPAPLFSFDRPTLPGHREPIMVGAFSTPSDVLLRKHIYRTHSSAPLVLLPIRNKNK
jgi:hypothetical protein